MKILLAKSPFSFLLGLAVLFLASCGNNAEQVAGGSNSTETGDPINLTGRVVGSTDAPIPGVVVTLVKAGLSDTTDSLGKYRIVRNALTKPSAQQSASAILDTLIFTQNGQVDTTLGVTNLVDSLPDVVLVQRDVSGNLLPSPVQIGKVEAVLSGSSISTGQPLVAQFGYLPKTNSYSGFLYFPPVSSIQNYSVYIKVYDTEGHFTGESPSVAFSSIYGDITIPTFNPGNAIPIAFAGDDTTLGPDSLLSLRGTAVDSFGGAIAKWEWDIGGTGVFKTTSSGDTTILTPSLPGDDYLCILKVIDTSGNTSPSDTLVVRIPPGAPAVSVPSSTNSPVPTWSWTAGTGGNGSYRYRLDNANLSTGATSTTVRSYTPTSNLANGLHTLCVQEQDMAGIWSASGCASVTVNYTPLAAPIVMLNPAVSSTTNTQPTWVWSSGGGGNGTYRMELDNSNLSTGSTQTTALSYTPDSAIANGSHTLYVQERDSSGDWSASGSASVIVLNAATSKLEVVGASGTILKSTDSGTTWTAQSNTLSSQDLYSVYYVTANTGWAVGNDGTILNTVNPTPMWEPQATVSTTQSLNSVYFVDKNTGWAVGNAGVYATTNSGTAWAPQGNQLSLELDSLNAVYFENANTGWAVGNHGTLLNTPDGGNTWTVQTSGTTSSLNSIQFINASTGWASGTGGIVLKTTNGGTTWQVQTSGTTSTLYSIHFADANTGWAVGTGGVILNTVNGGATWTVQTSGTTNSLWSVYFSNDNMGWTVGNNGTILKTLNGGATWSAQTSGTTKTLRGITPIQ